MSKVPLSLFLLVFFVPHPPLFKVSVAQRQTLPVGSDLVRKLNGEHKTQKNKGGERKTGLAEGRGTPADRAPSGCLARCSLFVNACMVLLFI